MELFKWLCQHSASIIGYLGMAFVIGSYCFKDIKTLRIVSSIGSALSMTYGFITETYPTAFLNLILLILNMSILIGNRLKRKRENNKKEQNVY